MNGALGVDSQPGGPWLGAPHPNPTSGLVAVPFCLPEAGTASLEVFDLQGRCVATLARGVTTAGISIRVWDARHVASGLHFVRLRVAGWEAARRVVLLK